MTTPNQKVTTILQNWQGSDDADRPTARQVAETIDLAYRDYLRELDAQVAAIKNLEQFQQLRLAS